MLSWISSFRLVVGQSGSSCSKKGGWNDCLPVRPKGEKSWTAARDWREVNFIQGMIKISLWIKIFLLVLAVVKEYCYGDFSSLFWAADSADTKLASFTQEVNFILAWCLVMVQALFPAWLFTGDFSSRTRCLLAKRDVTKAFFQIQSSLVIYVLGQCCLVITVRI